MRYCSHCMVQVRGNKDKCPLCRNLLPEIKAEADTESIYPVIPPTYQYHLVMRIMIFSSVVAIVASFVISKIHPSDMNWFLLTILGLLSMWLSLILVMRKKYNITKNIMWQVIILSGLAVFWDWKTGWRGWSFDYLIPVLCVSAMLVMYATAKIMKLRVRDYISYFLLNGLFGIVPILFILFGWAKVLYPSILCVGVSVVFLAAIVIFQGESIKTELGKRMHI